MRPVGIRSTITLAAALLAVATVRAAPTPASAPTHAAVPAPPRPVAPSASAATLPAVTSISDACPALLPVTQTIAETIAGWTPLNQQGNHAFVRIAFYPGPPADTRLIVPTIEFQGSAGLHDGWYLPPRQGGYWMTCAYANTTATVTRPLPAGIDFCQADYDKRFVTLVVRRWTCGLRRVLAPPKPPSKPPYKHGT